MPHLRLFPRKWRKLSRVLLGVLIIATSIDVYFLNRSFRRQSILHAPRLLAEDELPSLFIASIQSKSPAQDPKAWARAVEGVAAHIGPDRTFVSIYEEIADQDHREALKQLERNLDMLGVGHSIVFDNRDSIREYRHTWAAQGLAVPPRATRYVPYLAEMRNMALRPMIQLALDGVRFDKILFLEDVIFSSSDVLRLLSTRNGSYGVACALDFDQYGNLCDILALRDSNGDIPVTLGFPYFRSKTSRNALMAKKAVPVKSCWNNMLAFDAKPFYQSLNPAVFRGIPQTLAEHNLEASERCLIHFDNPYNTTEDRLGVWNPNNGIWINPQVRLGCAGAPSFLSDTSWPSAYSSITGIWKNRFWRWCTFTFYRDWVIKRRVRSWEKKFQGSREPGMSCLFDKV